MNNKNFSYYLSHFLKEYLVIERNISPNTIKSYKKTFQLLIEYLVNTKNINLNNINFSSITLEIIIDFLNYLENDRHNSIRTRNQRLAAIKSFYHYCTIEEVENISNIHKILSIKAKKETKKVVNYLTEEELESIFNSIDISTKKGKRDLVLLSLLYDTAARASEIIQLRLEDIRLDVGYIILHGKGRKDRIVQIMSKTRELLIQYINEFEINDKLFKENSSYELVRYICIKYKNVIPNKSFTPHVLRHTRAVHLLDHGVPLIYIQELLGHADIATTEIYATVIEKTKFKAIEQATPSYRNESLADWNDDQDLLSQLLNL
jgi:site-specific recombinase XerD